LRKVSFQTGELDVSKCNSLPVTRAVGMLVCHKSMFAGTAQGCWLACLPTGTNAPPSSFHSLSPYDSHVTRRCLKGHHGCHGQCCAWQSLARPLCSPFCRTSLKRRVRSAATRAINANSGAIFRFGGPPTHPPTFPCRDYDHVFMLNHNTAIPPLDFPFCSGKGIELTH
jgi:hypothetical protein